MRNNADLGEPVDLPDNCPAYLKRDESDAPVPSWAQITRSVSSVDSEMIAAVSRIVGGTGEESTARSRWDTWPPNYQRSVGLLIDKICHEGWLDAVGEIEGWPYDGGFRFWTREDAGASVAEALKAKSRKGGTYTECALRSGLFAALSGWNHRAWPKSWIENDVANASLHVGLLEDGRAEVHLDLFNPLFTNGAPRSELIGLAGVGFFNRRQFLMHRRWDQSQFAGLVRRSANYYHLMRDKVPLSF